MTDEGRQGRGPLLLEIIRRLTSKTSRIVVLSNDRADPRLINEVTVTHSVPLGGLGHRLLRPYKNLPRTLNGRPQYTLSWGLTPRRINPIGRK